MYNIYIYAYIYIHIYLYIYIYICVCAFGRTFHVGWSLCDLDGAFWAWSDAAPNGSWNQETLTLPGSTRPKLSNMRVHLHTFLYIILYIYICMHRICITDVAKCSHAIVHPVSILCTIYVDIYVRVYPLLYMYIHIYILTVWNLECPVFFQTNIPRR
jgi:hypothetical protein